MAYRIAINGFGRIGRSILRALYESTDNPGLQSVAINYLADSETLAHLTAMTVLTDAFWERSK